MDITSIPNYIPSLTNKEKRMIQAIRNHDDVTLLNIVINTPEVLGLFLDIIDYGYVTISDLITTMNKNMRLFRRMLVYYPKLPLNRTSELDALQRRLYLSNVERILGHIPKEFIDDSKWMI
jgi:hypothetical protein